MSQLNSLSFFQLYFEWLNDSGWLQIVLKWYVLMINRCYCKRSLQMVTQFFKGNKKKTEEEQ